MPFGMAQNIFWGPHIMGTIDVTALSAAFSLKIFWVFFCMEKDKKELSGTRKPRFLSNGAWSIYRSGKRLLQPFYFCYRTFGLGKMAYVKLLTLICITNDPKIYCKYISNHNLVAKLFRNSFQGRYFSLCD